MFYSGLNEAIQYNIMYRYIQSVQTRNRAGIDMNIFRDSEYLYIPFHVLESSCAGRKTVIPYIDTMTSEFLVVARREGLRWVGEVGAAGRDGE